jgi:hypothetical protein
LAAALTADGILIEIIRKSQQVAALEAAAWTIEQIGKQPPQIASGIIQKSVVDALCETSTAAKSDDLRAKAKEAIKLVIGQPADIAEIRTYMGRTQLAGRDTSSDRCHESWLPTPT